MRKAASTISLAMAFSVIAALFEFLAKTPRTQKSPGGFGPRLTAQDTRRSATHPGFRENPTCATASFHSLKNEILPKETRIRPLAVQMNADRRKIGRKIAQFRLSDFLRSYQRLSAFIRGPKCFLHSSLYNRLIRLAT